MFTGEMRFDREEALEDAVDLGGGDADAGVDDEDPGIPALALDLDPDLAALVGEGQRIADQVAQGDFDLVAIPADDDRGLAGHVTAALDLFLAGRFLKAA